jgi:hypothetical protein
VVLIVAGILSATNADAGAKRHAKVACPKGMKRLGRARCRGTLPAPQGDQLGELETAAWTAAQTVKMPPVSRRHKKKVPVALRTGLPAKVTGSAPKTALKRAFTDAVGMYGLNAPAVGARVATVTTQQGSEAGPSHDGWNTKLSGKTTRDDDRIGMDDTDASVTATKEIVIDGLKLNGEIVLDTRLKQLVDKCPDSEGNVPGDGTDSYGLSVAATSDKAGVTADGRIGFTWKYLGHVSDGGVVHSFDVSMKMRALIEGGVRGDDGRLYSQEPPHLYTISTDIPGVDPNDPEATKAFDEEFGGRMVAHSLLGHVYYDDDVAKKLNEITEKLVSWHLVEVAGYYRQAQTYWQTPGNCVKVSPSASTTTLTPGQQVPVTATINGPPQAHKGLAPGTFTATASSGQITPASGSYTPGTPLQFTFTAPSSGKPSVTITTTSRQGKGTGTITFTVGQPHYELVYSHSSQLAYSGTPEQVAAAPKPGTEVRNEHWQLTSTIPLTGDPATGLSGTAPIDYQQAGFHLDWEGSFSGVAGPDSCDGSDVTDLVSTTPGVAKVIKLTIPTPSTASLEFDAGATWPTETTHNVQTYRQCDGADNTDTGNQWYGEWQYFGFQHNLMTDVAGHDVVKIDSGWQAGTGDVIAKRTIGGTFPWGGAPDTPSTSTWTDTYEIVKTPS